MIWIHVLEQILRLQRIPSETFQDGLQVLRVDHATSFWIKHIEYAFEIVYLLPRIHLKYFVSLAERVGFLIVVVALLFVVSLQLLLHFLLIIFFVILVDAAVVLLFILPLSVILTFLEFLLVHF